MWSLRWQVYIDSYDIGVCVCVCACVRVQERVYVHTYTHILHTYMFTHARTQRMVYIYKIIHIHTWTVHHTYTQFPKWSKRASRTCSTWSQSGADLKGASELFRMICLLKKKCVLRLLHVNMHALCVGAEPFVSVWTRVCMTRESVESVLPRGRVD
jgi:hypothetical protein